MKKSQLRQLVREILNEEEYDMKDTSQPSKLIHRSQYAQSDKADREKAALKAIDFPSDVITDFSKGSSYLKKALTITGLRDLVNKSTTVDDFIRGVKEKIGGKVSKGVLTKIYNAIK